MITWATKSLSASARNALIGRMQAYAPIPAENLVEVQRSGRANGLRYAYMGNVEAAEGGEARCHECGAFLINRIDYEIMDWQLGLGGICSVCGTVYRGLLRTQPGIWSSRRLPGRMADFRHSATQVFRGRA